MAVFVSNTINPGEFNNYVVGGNLVNAFCLGDLGSDEDFFLIGAEPPEESTYPLITGNVLDDEGNVLLRLVRNVITFNPGHCSKVLGDHVGYEIHDSAGNMVFRVRSLFEQPPGLDHECYTTTLSGTFFDREGQAVFQASNGTENDRIEASVKAAFGYGGGGGFGIVMGMNDADLEVAAMALSTGGAVHQILRGRYQNENIVLDGKALLGAEIEKCTIEVGSGNFVVQGPTVRNSKFVFTGEAERIRQLVLAIAGSGSTADGSGSGSDA